MLSLKFDFSEFEKKIEGMVDAMDEATRPAAHAGAVVLYEEVQARVKAKPAGKTAALPREITENLLKSVYRAFAEQQSFPQARKSAGYTTATYRITFNHTTAPHGWLVEHGHWQYYMVRLDPDGYWYTVKRPDAKGPPPNPRAGRAAMDAYYVRWKDGPRWVEPQPFLRPAWDAKVQQALRAVAERYFQLLRERL